MIYLVEDDDSIRELVLYTLHTTGFEAEGFRNAADFWQALEKELPQLVLLDIMLPDEDGLHILKRLRAGRRKAANMTVWLGWTAARTITCRSRSA